MAPTRIEKKGPRPTTGQIKEFAALRLADARAKKDQEKIQKCEEIIKGNEQYLQALTPAQLGDIMPEEFDPMEVDTDTENSIGEDPETKINDPAIKVEYDQGANGNGGNTEKTTEGEPIQETIEKSEALFVPDSGPDSDSEATYVDPEFGRALLPGLGSKIDKDFKTVGWFGKRTHSFINRYGPKNASRYRIENFSDPSYTLPVNEEVIRGRCGEDKINGRWKYSRRHVFGVFAIAWPTISGIDRKDLNLIDPALVKNWLSVPTLALVFWNTEGGVKKCWETRTTVRRLFRNRNIADNQIYAAALEAEDNYEEVKTGKRPARSVSPAEGLIQSFVNGERDKSLVPSGLSASTASTPMPSSVENISVSQLEALKTLLELLNISGIGPKVTDLINQRSLGTGTA